MKKRLLQLLCILAILPLFFIFPKKSYALYDPLSVQNNFYGIHILFPEEISDAAKLVNSSGGDWGYVTIPIQIRDRDYDKWEKFMEDARRLHIIPILRISTEGDPNNTSVWRIPDDYDIVDLSNFLNSLDWPVENRYVIAFNETNRFDEWGGDPPDPKKYTDILSYTVDAFKQRNKDFFIIMGGLDNAAPNQPAKYLNSFVYLQDMIDYQPDIFDKIDGFASHSYPNPNFSEPPSTKVMGVSTYSHEYDFINAHTTSPKPVFITETGWNSDVLSEDTISQYYQYTFDNLWKEDANKIVAITPFLLNSNGGFNQFSFMKNGQPTEYYKTVQNMPKVKGKPKVTEPKIQVEADQKKISVLSSTYRQMQEGQVELSPFLKLYFKSLLGEFM